jgi:hypothetical protein
VGEDARVGADAALAAALAGVTVRASRCGWLGRGLGPRGGLLSLGHDGRSAQGVAYSLAQTLVEIPEASLRFFWLFALLGHGILS